MDDLMKSKPRRRAAKRSGAAIPGGTVKVLTELPAAIHHRFRVLAVQNRQTLSKRIAAIVEADVRRHGSSRDQGCDDLN